jgi:cob(I)alamin adenosyltransferase
VRTRLAAAPEGDADVDERAGRPEAEDYDLLTIDEAGARLRTEIDKQRRLLERLEERMFYVGEDTAVATEIAAIEQRLEALQEAAERYSHPRVERLAEEIDRASKRLELLEERMFYVGEDKELATEIGKVERRLEQLKAEEKTRSAGRDAGSSGSA